jgi:hypothetical protein
MSQPLSSFGSVQANLFVTLDIPDYEILYFSDYHTVYTLNGKTYDGLGQLLNIVNTSNSLRANSKEFSITISGIPSANIPEILNTKIKGSNLQVVRAYFNPVTGVLLDAIDNPSTKFTGIITNYDIEDELREGSSEGTITIILLATSTIDLLNNKIAGRRTNPLDQKEFYPSDESMDRVFLIANSNFNFGAPN